jgi:prolyl 4-hydroxylase
MLKWPTDGDFSGAASALSRLQDTYKLDPNDFANGRLNGEDTG